MPVFATEILRLKSMVGPRMAAVAVHLAIEQDELEQRFKRIMEEALDLAFSKAFQSLESIGKIPKGQIQSLIEDAMIRIYFESMKAGMQGAGSLQSIALAKKSPEAKSLKDLMKQWELWQERKWKPARPIKYAEKISTQYLKKIYTVWTQNAGEFIKGDPVQRYEIEKKIQRDLNAERARASTIVQTETTRYYNQARREFYDESDEITHYLFISIRDARTTKWCLSRSGVVFTKGSELLDRNTPPCHWNCRSEILPLSLFNPLHKRMIDDLSKRAENKKLEPLPRGWKK